MFWRKKKERKKYEEQPSWIKNPYTKAEFKKDLEDCIALYEQELENRKNGIEGMGTVDMIEAVLENLYYWLETVKSGENLSKKKKYGFEAGYLVLDGWDIKLRHPMTQKVGEISTNFDYLEV